jgi:SAM-dependent methyltransferase
MSVSCPLCDGTRLELFLERKGVPVHQNLCLPDPAAARRVRRGDLRLLVCRNCGFVSNTAFDSALLDYGSDYDNDQSYSTCFGGYVDNRIEHLLRQGVRARRVLEIGCGKGYFLTRLCQKGNNVGIGVDASYLGPERVLDGKVSFIRDVYQESHAAFQPDLVVCRHVIEHIPNPLDLLRSVRRGIAATPGARTCFETPDLRWILSNLVVQDFFYEHCSYFTADSLAFALRAVGFSPARVSHVFAGQYLWLEAGLAGAASGAAAQTAPTDKSAALLADYQHRETKALLAWSGQLDSLRRRGSLGVWGAGAKGVTFLNLLDRESRIVDCVVDINPRKQGQFLPGTGHPIVAPGDLAGRGVRSVLVMNRNYATEVRATIERLGLEVNVQVEGES